MKRFLSALLPAFSPLLLLAGPPAPAHSWTSGHLITAASAGYFMPDFTGVNSYMNNLGAAGGFGPLMTVGLTGAEPLTVVRSFGDRPGWDGGSSLEWVLPQEMKSGDSLSWRLKGWHLMTSIYGTDLIPGHMVALVVAPGVDWGNLKMLHTNKGVGEKYKNPFVAPFARAELRVVFWKIGLGVRASYRYDITKSHWKNGEDQMASFKMHGLGVQVFIGYGTVFR